MSPTPSPSPSPTPSPTPSPSPSHSPSPSPSPSQTSTPTPTATPAPYNMKLYVDGLLIKSMFTPFASSYSGYWKLGAYKNAGWQNGQDGYFSGYVATLVIYQKVLSEAEIVANYNALASYYANPICSSPTPTPTSSPTPSPSPSPSITPTPTPT